MLAALCGARSSKWPEIANSVPARSSFSLPQWARIYNNVINFSPQDPEGHRFRSRFRNENIVFLRFNKNQNTSELQVILALTQTHTAEWLSSL